MNGTQKTLVKEVPTVTAGNASAHDVRGTAGKECIGKRRLLIFAHYYFPDKASTGQLIKELAEGMLENFDITVICTVPSYEGVIDARYKTKKYCREELNGVHLIRVRVPEFNKQKKRSRARNIAVYFVRALIAAVKSDRQDCVMAISQPPILGGLLGTIGATLKRAKFLYVQQDFNPEQTSRVGYLKNKAILALMMRLDKLSCQRADKIVVPGRDMMETLRCRFKKGTVPACELINNWADGNEIYPLIPEDEEVLNFKQKYGLTDKFVFMYSGNIGLYYDLENLVRIIRTFAPGTKAADGREVVFAFVGAGAVKDKMVAFAEDNRMTNVVFIPYQDKAALNISLNAADVHLCINAAGLKGVSVPSKLYGIMAAGKPVAGVLEEGAEARLVIEEANCGVVCTPGDNKAIEHMIKGFLNMPPDSQKRFGANGRTFFEKNLTRDMSCLKYQKVINALCR